MSNVGEKFFKKLKRGSTYLLLRVDKTRSRYKIGIRKKILRSIRLFEWQVFLSGRGWPEVERSKPQHLIFLQT